MEKRERNKWIIICVTVVLIVATVVVFAVVGHSKKKKAEVATNDTVTVTTTAPTTTEPTTVDERGSTDSVKKMIALCFDDGPGTDSSKTLAEGLKERGQKATFFELGQMIEENPEVCQFISDCGSEIAIHGFTHSDFTQMGVDGTLKEVQETADLIKKYTGKTPTHVRPPYGSYNDDIQSALLDAGYDLIMWNVDTLDWKTRDASSVCDAIVNNGADGGDILCLHDIYESTAEGVLRAVDQLVEQGYQFVTISELQATRDKFVAGRIWLSAHEFYDYGSKENMAKASLTQPSAEAQTTVDANGNAVTMQQPSKQDATDDVITWPDDT